jgi:hypothetical protein
MARALFFAPLISTDPWRGLPPSTINRDTETPP